MSERGYRTAPAPGAVEVGALLPAAANLALRFRRFPISCTCDSALSLHAHSRTRWAHHSPCTRSVACCCSAHTAG